MKWFLKFFLLLSLFFGFAHAKLDMTFGKNVYLDDNVLSFELKNAKFDASLIGTITHKPIITCDNDLKGFIEYSSKNKITYFSSLPLKTSTKYTCITNPKYVNKSSKKSFYTDDFQAISVGFFKPNIFTIRFNDKVSEEELLKNLTLKKVTKLAKSNLSYKIERGDGRNFLLRTNENAVRVISKISKDVKNIYGTKALKDWEADLDDTGPEPKTYDNTKSFVLFDEPTWAIGEEGKIVLRVFSPNSFYGNNELKKFIQIKGIENFSLSKGKWLYDEEIKKYNLNEKSQYSFDIIGDFKPNTYYEVTFLKGFGNKYFQLFDSQTFKVKTQDYGLFVGFSDTKKPYISSAGDIGIRSVNVQKVQVVIDKMMEQNLRYYLNFDSSMNIDNISSEMVNKIFDIGGEKNKYQVHKIPLSKALKGLKKGVYQISLHYDGSKRVVKKVFLSDIGISAKVFKDGIFVYANSLKDAQAISDAKVEIYSAKNSLIAQGETNGDGVFKYNQKDFYSQKPKSILITKGEEQNFLILDNALNFDSVDIYPAHEQKAFIYFQSDLIRPDAKLKGVVVLKDKNFKSLKNAPIGIWIVNLQNHKRIYEKSYKSDGVGSFDFDIDLKGQSTGQYRFMVRYKNKVISSKKFLIKAFLPQKIKNNIKLSKKTFKLHEQINLDASSNYLFGSPAANLKAEARLKVVPKSYENEKFKGYNFNDEIKEEESKVFYADVVKNFKLDAHGKAQVSLTPNINKLPPSILRGQIELGVYDDGRKVSTYEDVLIYPYKSMVGLKLANDMLDNDTAVDIKTILIDPMNNKELNATLDVFVYNEDWYYNYDSNGYYKWNKELKRVEHFTMNSKEGIKKRFERSGDYVIVVQDALSGHSSSVKFSVRGWNYSSISPNTDVKQNEVKFENKLYKKGDEVKLDIKSPIKEGKLLVTLEGKEVFWYKVLSFKEHRAKVDVPLDADLDDGLFISTIAIRSSDSSDKLIPFRTSSVSFVRPNRNDFKLNPKITSEDKIKSDTNYTISVKAKPNSKVLISLVDDGILQILDQKAPKPFKFFTIKPKERILNFDMYDFLLNYKIKGKALDFGSGALAKRMMDKAKKHLAPKTGAKRVKPFMYFSKLLSVDESGEVKVSLKIPASFNGSASIVAIEISEDKIGASSKKVLIKDDVIIKPIMPRYGNIGDEWQIQVRVFNTTKKELEVSLNSQTNKFLKVSGFDGKLKLKPKSSQLLSLNAKVLGFGKGKIKLIAKSASNSFSNSVELPLIYAYPLSTYALSGQSKEKVELKAPKEYFEKTPKFSLSVSGDVMAQLKGDSDDLVGYPYGCAEQTSSKILALLNIKPFLDENAKDYKAKLSDSTRFINEGIYKLSTMQKSSGDFGYWDINSYTNVYASVYASDVLIDLKQNGYQVPDEMINDIKRALRYEYKHFNDTTIKVYALYLLANLGEVDVEKVNYMYDNKLYQGSLPSFYMMAYVLKKAKMDSEAGHVLKQAYDYKFKPSKRNHWSFYSDIKDKSFALYLLVKHFGKNQTSDRLFSTITREFKNLYSTQDKAFVLRAINEYYKDYKGKENRFALTTQNIDEIYSYKANIDGVLSKNSVKIGPLNDWVSYSFSVYAYLPKKVLHEQTNKDLDIYRIFVDENNKEIDLANLKLGQQIYSKITIKSLEDLYNIAIVEQIPSCFEFSDERISRFKSDKLDFKDIRDDRAMMFLELKAKKEKVFYTPITASVKGNCLLPPILAEAMYDERIKDYDLQIKSLSVK